MSMNREEEMLVMFRSGVTMSEIGAKYGMCRERVRQLLKEYFGVTGKDKNGGRYIGIEERRAQRAANADKRRHRRAVGNGCDSWQEFLELYTPARRLKYTAHKANVRRIGQKWQFKFGEWMRLWLDSGKWDKRGKGADEYCMTRIDTALPWSKDNVRIDTFSSIGYERRIEWWNKHGRHNDTTVPGSKSRARSVANRKRAQESQCDRPVDGRHQSNG